MLTKQHPKALRTLFPWYYNQADVFDDAASTPSPNSGGNLNQPSPERKSLSTLPGSIQTQLTLLRHYFVDSTKNFREPLVERRILLIIVDTLILLTAASLAYNWSGPESLTLDFLNLPPRAIASSGK